MILYAIPMIGMRALLSTVIICKPFASEPKKTGHKKGTAEPSPFRWPDVGRADRMRDISAGKQVGPLVVIGLVDQDDHKRDHEAEKRRHRIAVAEIDPVSGEDACGPEREGKASDGA